MLVEDDGLARPQVPQLCCAAIAPGGDLTPVGPEGHGEHKALMTVQGCYQPACGNVPHPGARILARRHQPLAVAAEGQAVDEALVPEEALFQGAGLDVPDPDRLIPASRGHSLAVGTERDAEDPSLVPAEFA